MRFSSAFAAVVFAGMIALPSSLQAPTVSHDNADNGQMSVVGQDYFSRPFSKRSPVGTIVKEGEINRKHILRKMNEHRRNNKDENGKKILNRDGGENDPKFGDWQRKLVAYDRASPTFAQAEYHEAKGKKDREMVAQAWSQLAIKKAGMGA